MPLTRSLLEELQLRIDSENMYRKVSELIEPRAHIGLFSLDGHGDQEQINCATILTLGTDYVEVTKTPGAKSGRLIDRRDIREIDPINF